MYNENNSYYYRDGPVARAIEENLAKANALIELRLRDEQERILLLERAKAENVQVVHVFDKDEPKGGLTIAFRKCSPYSSGNMVTVAVATCSYSDTFNRKVGTNYALYAFFNGNTIDLPLSFGEIDEDLAGRVKRKFSKLYFLD